jgi:hypothetical protein
LPHLQLLLLKLMKIEDNLMEPLLQFHPNPALRDGYIYGIPRRRKQQ